MVESKEDAPKSWDEIKKELVEEAEKIMEGWDGYTVIKEDHEHNLVSKSFPQPHGLTGLMTKYVSKKLKWEHIEELRNNLEHHMHTMNPNQTDTRLPDQGGYKCYLEK